MTLKQFIQAHKEEIDQYILQIAPGTRITNEERRMWISNDEKLYLWAKASGCRP